MEGDATVIEPEQWWLEVGVIGVADTDRIEAGYATSPDHSPILLLPASDPAVAKFLALIEGSHYPVAFVGETWGVQVVPGNGLPT